MDFDSKENIFVLGFGVCFKMGICGFYISRFRAMDEANKNSELVPLMC